MRRLGRARRRRVEVHAGLGELLRGLRVGDAARALAPRAQPVDQPRPAFVTGAAQRQLVGPGLADPALVLRARRAQLAHLPARAAGEERLGALAPQERAAADDAGEVLLIGADVARAGHLEAREGNNAGPPVNAARAGVRGGRAALT